MSLIFEYQPIALWKAGCLSSRAFLGPTASQPPRIYCGGFCPAGGMRVDALYIGNSQTQAPSGVPCSRLRQKWPFAKCGAVLWPAQQLQKTTLVVLNSTIDPTWVY
jgi:hypothetical protein